MNIEDYRKMPYRWSKTGDAEFPLMRRDNGQLWQIRLNDFPAEPLLTLLIDGAEIRDLNSWPDAWER